MVEDLRRDQTVSRPYQLCAELRIDILARRHDRKVVKGEELGSRR